MEIKLYSTAHMTAAKVLYPSKINQTWCETQWTDDEINECKSYEFMNFCANPSIDNFPLKLSSELFTNREEYKILDEILSKNNKIKSFLSVGCGFGLTELGLAKKYPEIQFLAIDSAPYVECLNKIAQELSINNINFKMYDLRNGNIGIFDLVYSMSVIYCIPKKYLESYFDILNSSAHDESTIVVGCTSNLTPSSYLRILTRLLLIALGLMTSSTSKLLEKQTGWLRSVRDVERLISSVRFEIKETHYLYHISKIRLINRISKNIYPLVNRGYLFVLKRQIKRPE